MTDLTPKTEQTYCSECNGGWANPIHGPGDPMTGHHEFQYAQPAQSGAQPAPLLDEERLARAMTRHLIANQKPDGTFTLAHGRCNELCVPDLARAYREDSDD